MIFLIIVPTIIPIKLEPTIINANFIICLNLQITVLILLLSLIIFISFSFDIIAIINIINAAIMITIVNDISSNIINMLIKILNTIVEIKI